MIPNFDRANQPDKISIFLAKSTIKFIKETRIWQQSINLDILYENTLNIGAKMPEQTV